MQNNPQISQDGIMKAANIWKTTNSNNREETFKNLCESQHVDYSQAKVQVIELLKNKDPRIMNIVRRFQQLGIR